MNRNIVAAITGQPEPPCDVYKCEHKRECYGCGKACVAFYRYITSASGRFPSTPMFREATDFYYHKIFESEE